MSNENMNLTKVIVPCRFSYLYCWEPNVVNDGDPKYSVSVIIPKSDTETIGKIKRAIEQAKKDSVSNLYCWEPNVVNDGDPKYSVSVIIPKSDTETIGKIKRAIEQAKKDSVSKWGGKVPANLRLPLRDGDIDHPEDEAYADSHFFNANSKQAPQVVDKNVHPILDQSEVYSGCYGRISVNFYGFSTNGRDCRRAWKYSETA